MTFVVVVTRGTGGGARGLRQRRAPPQEQKPQRKETVFDLADGHDRSREGRAADRRRSSGQQRKRSKPRRSSRSAIAEQVFEPAKRGGTPS
jgi:hypothetical protein